MVEPQSQQKLAAITNFTKQFHSKKHHTFYEHQLTHHYEKYTSTAQPKTLFTLQIFQQTRFWLVSDKTFALHHF